MDDRRGGRSRDTRRTTNSDYILFLVLSHAPDSTVIGGHHSLETIKAIHYELRRLYICTHAIAVILYDLDIFGDILRAV